MEALTELLAGLIKQAIEPPILLGAAATVLVFCAPSIARRAARHGLLGPLRH